MNIIRWLFVNCALAKLINHPSISITVPSVTGLYGGLGVLDIELMTIYPNVNKYLFIGLVCATIFITIFISISNVVKPTVEAYATFLEDFMSTVSSIVNLKLRRFKKASKDIAKNGNTFNRITKPDIQIEHINAEAVKLLRKTFGLEEDAICITILHANGREDKQYFAFNTRPNWNHTKPKTLLKEDSTAKHCLERGEPIFIPSKIDASEKKEYYLSERDKRMGDGSIFCYSTCISNQDYEDKYVISIDTYGKRICEPKDKVSGEIAKTVLTEVCRRLDVELTLHSIKSWQNNYAQKEQY